jgi:fatty-acyl-CoA synthase
VRNAGVGSWPERRLRSSPDRDALWFEGTTTSHGGFAMRVRQTAAARAGLGVRHGDRVAWTGANHPSALETLYACGQLGAVWVPVNARLTAPEAEYVLAHSGASVVVHGRDHGTLADALRDRLPGVRTWVAAEPPVDGGADSLPYGELLAAAAEELRDEPVLLDDPCLIMYTSGTTGRPKGAVLTHGNMTWNAVNQAMGMDITAGDRTLGLAPLFHIGGLNGTVNPTLLRGGCAVLLRRFDPPETLRVIEEQRVNSFFAVPTMLDAMSRLPEFHTRDLSQLRTIGAAGAALPLPTLRTWLDRGVTMQQCYGMTEAAPGCTVLDSADAERKIGSAGKALFFTDVRVVDPEGAELPPGEVGEVLVQGPNVMSGYWEDPAQGAAVRRDGWYHTGDAGSVDEEGFLYIRDRYKDMIISGGENVYPAEVESALLELPAVQEAAVIGVPDERWGEAGLALVVPTPGADTDPETVRAELRARLAGFKVPREVRFLHELPKTATGKIRKPDLRARYAPKQTETNETAPTETAPTEDDR